MALAALELLSEPKLRTCLGVRGGGGDGGVGFLEGNFCVCEYFVLCAFFLDCPP